MLSVAVVWALVTSAEPATGQAQLNQYPPGVPSQMMGGYVPPAGTLVLDNSTLIYCAREFVGASGNVTDFDTAVAANRAAVLWTSEFKFFGVDYPMAGVFPITNFAARPQPGHESTVGLGDIYLQPFTLGWHRKPVHALAAYGVIAPTGRFKYGAADNTGRGFWAHRLGAGITYIQQAERPWHATIAARYDFPSEVKGTNIRPGQAAILERSAGKVLADRVGLGVLGYWLWQTSDVTGSDFTGDPARYRIAGVGPEVRYIVRDEKGLSLILALRNSFDFGVGNGARGVLTIFSVAARF